MNSQMAPRANGGAIIQPRGRLKAPPAAIRQKTASTSATLEAHEANWMGVLVVSGITIDEHRKDSTLLGIEAETLH
jgi:hypothetical protein